MGAQADTRAHACVSVCRTLTQRKADTPPLRDRGSLARALLRSRARSLALLAGSLSLCLLPPCLSEPLCLRVSAAVTAGGGHTNSREKVRVVPCNPPAVDACRWPAPGQTGSGASIRSGLQLPSRPTAAAPPPSAAQAGRNSYVTTADTSEHTRQRWDERTSVQLYSTILLVPGRPRDHALVLMHAIRGLLRLANWRDQVLREYTTGWRQRP